jgi:hypothetical protein
MFEKVLICPKWDEKYVLKTQNVTMISNAL